MEEQKDLKQLNQEQEVQNNTQKPKKNKKNVLLTSLVFGGLSTCFLALIVVPLVFKQKRLHAKNTLDDFLDLKLETKPLVIKPNETPDTNKTTFISEQEQKNIASFFNQGFKNKLTTQKSFKKGQLPLVSFSLEPLFINDKTNKIKIHFNEWIQKPENKIDSLTTITSNQKNLIFSFDILNFLKDYQKSENTNNNIDKEPVVSLNLLKQLDLFKTFFTIVIENDNQYYYSDLKGEIAIRTFFKKTIENAREYAEKNPDIKDILDFKITKSIISAYINVDEVNKNIVDCHFENIIEFQYEK
ncbi:hypothetical protein [[Mycoplasma] anseris]|uniref:Transmembrane protein n=1 Tax=[Mycoplasma] anseris TaxID=92400 RepID=A0A2Z4NDM0_9BACT|nr:hypothetical protein [[Mycoplasma] anseris]AWX69608.1 hypothetical protein DP065_02535 [[Mycoplasma] anseris]